MKSSFKQWVVVSLIFTMLLTIGFEVALAQQYVTFKGKVVSIYKKQLSVKDDKGITMNFVFGRRTAFNPSRLPAVGERIEVDYLLRRGSNVAYQVRIKAAK